MSVIKRIAKDISRANGECESTLERIPLWYKAFVSFALVFPLLYIAGFIVGLLLLANPHRAGIETIEGLF